MELKLINDQGIEASQVKVSDLLFGREYNEALIHQVVTAYQANARSGNRAQKDRQSVKHTTKKPWRQKGTGRARVGMSSSPLWRGGGKIFPNSPNENFSHKLNKKMYRSGMAAIFSQLAREDRIVIVDNIYIDTPKTKNFAVKIRAMGFDSVLIVMDNIDENIVLASRNLPNVVVVEVAEVDPVSLIRFPKVLMTKSALAKFEELLG
jgi:large subunit ribosomal protein L4